MAANPTNGLTFTFGDRKKNLSADALKSVIENALEMLKSVESEFVTDDATVKWEISRISMQSPVTMTFSPVITPRRGRTFPRRRFTEQRMVKAAAHDIAAIERNGVAPAHFSEDGLLAVQKIVALARKEGTKIKAGLNRETQITLTEKAEKRVTEIVEKAKLYVDYSTIEGLLETVSVHGGTSFVVWEMMTNAKVECSVSGEQFAQWKDYLGKRVALTGRVHFRNHVPKSIVVDSIRVLRDAKELPQPKDIGPINLTDGAKSEEHVRRLRNA